LLGDIAMTQQMLQKQLSMDRKRVTLLSMHCLMVAHLNFFAQTCQFDDGMYDNKMRAMDVCKAQAIGDTIRLTDVLSDILRSLPSMNLSPNRITYDLLINGGALCDDKHFILTQMHNLSMLMRPARTKLNDPTGDRMHFTLTSRTFAAMMYPYIQCDKLMDGQIVLQMMDSFVPMKNGQKRRDYRALELEFVQNSTASVQPFFYSFQQDFCQIFPDEKCNSLLKPLYSIKNFNKKMQYEKVDEISVKKLQKEYKKKHKYLSGISKIRGIKKHNEKKKQTKAIFGRKGKVHKRHNIT